MPKIEIIKPIVDAQGKFQPDYELRIDSEGVKAEGYERNATKNGSCNSIWQNPWDGGMSLSFRFDPPYIAPKLAEVFGQGDEFYVCTEDDYLSRPAGQEVYDGIIAAELLMLHEPRVLSKKDFTPKFVRDVIFSQIITNVDWAHKTFPKTYVCVWHDNGKERQGEKRVNRPESEFANVHAYCSLPFSESIPKGIDFRPKGVDFRDLVSLLNLATGDSIEVSFEEGKLSMKNSSPYGKGIGFAYSGVILSRLCDNHNIAAGVKFREEAEEFIMANYDKLAQMASELKEVKSAAQKLASNQFGAKEVIVYAGTPVCKLLKPFKSDLERVLSDIAEELKSMPKALMVPIL